MNMVCGIQYNMVCGIGHSISFNLSVLTLPIVVAKICTVAFSNSQKTFDDQLLANLAVA